MRENIIRIEPFEIVTLLSFNAKQETNQHGEVKFSAIIDESYEEQYLMYAANATWAKVIINDFEGKEDDFFIGVVTDLYIDSNEGVKKLFVTIKTGTYLMDVSMHTRTYQTPSMLYNDVFANFTSTYESSGIISNIEKSETIGSLIVQYRETDWEFAKRLASHFNMVLLPEYQRVGIKYFVGINNIEAKTVINTKTYSVRKDIDEFQYKQRYKLGLSELDCLCYIFDSREIYTLGEQINFNEKKLNVFRIDTKFERGELIHTYYLKTKNGFKINKKFNINVIGLGFYAKIVDVQKDVVMVSVDEDENAGSSGVRWFPYSTVYSTPDGTGWYCMPEKGDSVRLYLPTIDEAEAYVISSTHMEVDKSQNTHNSASERANPDYKSIMNKQGKEVLFTPTSIIITNNKGMSVEILDEVGIKIVSDKTISIFSDEDIHIASTKSNITAIAENYILMKQGDQFTRIEDNIAHSGAQVHLD